MESKLTPTILALLTCFCPSSGSDGLFHKLGGYRLKVPILSETVCQNCIAQSCILMCLQTDSCKSLSFSLQRGVCQLSRKLLHDAGVTWEQHSDWDYYERHSDVVWHGDWVLAFRATKSIGMSVYDSWVSNATYHDFPALRSDVSPGCRSLRDHGCTIHFRSRLVDKWNQPEFQINQVKVVFVRDVIVADITFNGIGTDRNSWFSRGHLLNSSWTDLETETNFQVFSVHGDPVRRFAIIKKYMKCPTDFGWVVTVDRNYTCQYDDQPSYPRFLYSTQQGGGKLNSNEVSQADTMAILVKFSRK